MFNIGSGELALILVVALLVLGPKRLPELARGLGKFMREFRRQTDEVRSVVEREFYRMDQDVADVGPKLEAPAGSVAQVPAADPEALPPRTDSTPSQLTAPMDESDPGHPDYHRAEPVADAAAAPSVEPAAPAAPAPAPADPKAKVG